MLMSTELICQWINTAAFVVPNAALLARPCHYFSLIIREPFEPFNAVALLTLRFMNQYFPECYQYLTLAAETP